MLPGCPVLAKWKDTKLGSSNQEASSSAGKNIEIVLVPCHAWKCVLTDISGGADISEVPECHLVRQMSFQLGSQNYFKEWCLMNSQPTYLFLTYF